MMNDDLIFNDLLKKNYDGRDKEVGDKVFIWDSIACFDENGIQIPENQIFKDHPMIVIDNDICEFVYITYLDIRYLICVDIKLYNTINKKIVFTNSEFCKIID